ncbi:10477_t:CDS:2, partial [Dentiscutata erythropus]
EGPGQDKGLLEVTHLSYLLSASLRRLCLKYIVETVVREVTKSLKTSQKKRHMSRLCYVCRRKGHMAHSCPLKDQGHDRSLNNKLMEVRRVDVGEKKCNERREEKFKDNDKMVRKMVKINGEFAETLIRVSSNVNKISVKYAKRVGFTWKRLNKRNNSRMDDGCIGFIHGVEVVVNDAKFVQKFHVMKDLSVDVVLGKPWFAALRYRCESKKNGDNNVDSVRIENGNVSIMNEKNICRKGPEKEYVPDIHMVNKEDPNREFYDVVDVRCMDCDESNRVNEYIPVVSNDDKTK